MMKEKESAGLAIVYQGMVLLAHTTGRKWWGSYGIPKGGIEPGESRIDAAIRETREEVGLAIPRSMINPNPRTYVLTSRKYKYTKTVYWYTVEVKDLGQIGLKDLVVPKRQLQLEEVDWAGFVPLSEAKKRVMSSQQQLLTQLVGLGLLESHHDEWIYTPEQQKIPSSMKHVKLFEQFIAESLTEAKKEKFILYTNPGNSTNAAYVAIGAADVKNVLSSAKRYSDSYRILYQGKGTQDDLVKAKQMFSNYRFGNESINEAKSIKDHMAKADEYKKQLMDLKKQAKTAKDPQAHQARIAAKEEQLRRVAEVIRNLRAEGVKEGDEFINEGDVSLKPGLFALVSIGGSIGSKPKYPIFASGSIGSIIETSDDKDALKETAKRMKSRLSPGERKYYGMSYTVTELTPSKIRQIEMLQSAQRDSANDGSIEESFEYEVVAEAKDLRQLQRDLDRLQNDYEDLLGDDELEALTGLISAVNLKLKRG